MTLTHIAMIAVGVVVFLICDFTLFLLKERAYQRHCRELLAKRRKEQERCER